MDIAIRHINTATATAPSTSVNTQSDESLLIEACVRRERWAQKKIYEMHYGKLMAVCMRYANSRDEAVDMLHEGFIKIFNHLSRYQFDTSLLAWMRRIMINTAIDCYRREQKHRYNDIDTAAYDLQDAEPDAISNCSEKDILAAVQQLAPSYRTVFNLYAIEGFSHREIAEAMGIAESTARANLAKARTKLQQLLTNQYPNLNGYED